MFVPLRVMRVLLFVGSPTRDLQWLTHSLLILPSFQIQGPRESLSLSSAPTLITPRQRIEQVLIFSLWNRIPRQLHETKRQYNTDNRKESAGACPVERVRNGTKSDPELGTSTKRLLHWKTELNKRKSTLSLQHQSRYQLQTTNTARINKWWCRREIIGQLISWRLVVVKWKFTDCSFRQLIITAVLNCGKFTVNN